MARLEPKKARRHLSQGEAELLSLLLASAGKLIARRDIERLEVEAMSDGGMGSLYIVHPSKAREGRRMGGEIASTEFSDDDGVLVSVTLNVDEDGDLFELDVWKADFTPTARLKIE